MTTLLSIDGLTTVIDGRGGAVTAVDAASLEVGRGEVLGIVGESGSGKSMLAFSVLRLIEEPLRIAGGRVLFDGRDLLRLPEPELRRIRGRRIAMIFQDPMMTLNPVLRVGAQMTETLRAHGIASGRAATERARDALGLVGIPSPAERLHAYPHQLSGGMRQRVVIAIALMTDPDLIIADEPTTALDVTIQGQILSEVQRLARERRMALIWITHDLSVVAGLADRLAVMYAGRFVEIGPTAALLAEPHHHYTRGLVGSVPSRTRRGQPLAQIPGTMPGPGALGDWCAFAPRCPRADALCRGRRPDLAPAGEGRRAACFHPVIEAAAA